MKSSLPKLILIFAAASLALAACGSSSGSSASSPQTAPDVLKLAYAAAATDPDPDIFYLTEANSIVDNVYDTLVQYAPDNSYNLKPDIASSWDISADGLTYTFHLRPNVKFHDGSTVTSADVQFSFERRAMKKINSGMAYLTNGIVGYQTPDANTLVVKLAQPNIDFLSNLASPYGVKVESKAIVTAHAVNGDEGQKWLNTHDAGTGPYQITDYEDGKQYVLDRSQYYWGPAPQIREVNIKVIPSATTQFLEFQQGELNLIFHGLTAQQLAQLSGNSKYKVYTFPTVNTLFAYVNTAAGVFANPTVRTALASAIDRKTVTSQVFGKFAQPGTTFYIAGELPAGQAADDPTYDPSTLKGLVGSLPSKNVSMVYTTDDAHNQQAAELIQTELQAVGLNATLSGVPLSQANNYKTEAAAKMPDLMITAGNPDSGNPDDFARAYVGTIGDESNGSLNGFNCKVPGLDQLIDAGLHNTDAASSQQDYAKAGDLAVTQGCFEPISSIEDTVSTLAGYGNINHQVATVWSIRFADITLAKS